MALDFNYSLGDGQITAGLVLDFSIASYEAPAFPSSGILIPNEALQNLNHRKYHLEMLTVTIPTKFVFVRSFHENNDPLAVSSVKIFD